MDEARSLAKNYSMKEFIRNFRIYYNYILAPLLEDENYSEAGNQLKNLRTVLLNIPDNSKYLDSLDSFLDSLGKDISIINSKTEFEKKLDEWAEEFEKFKER